MVSKKPSVVRLRPLTIQRPIPDRAYWFVRPTDREPDWRIYLCYGDGSATTADLESETIWENDPDVWQRAWQSSIDDGYVLFNDAVADGWIAPNAQPPSDLSTVYGKPQPNGDE